MKPGRSSWLIALIVLTVAPLLGPSHGAVERANRTHTKEFYEVTAYSLQIAPLNQELRQSERIYNTVRPHQALGYLTLREFLAHWQAQPNKARCH